MTAETARASPDVGADWAGHQLDRSTVAALRSEAESSRFTHVVSSRFGLRVADRKLTSPFDFASAPGRDRAVALGTSAGLLERAGSPAGRGVRFHSATYLVYGRGSYIGIHTDRPGCDVNVLFLLAGAPTAVEIHPALARCDVRQVFEMSRTGHGFVPGGVLLPLARPGAGVCFHSGVIPHQRRPMTHPLLLLSICYSLI